MKPFSLYSDRAAWRTSAGAKSFAELEHKVRSAAAGLIRLGVKPGDHWALKGLSAFDSFALILAGLWQKAVMFPLPDRLPDTVHQQMMDQVPLHGCIDPGFMVPDEELPGEISIDDDAPALGIFTSGSTGTPKAIVHSWSSLSSSARASNAFYELVPGDSWLLSLDLAHIGGWQIALRCFLGGGICWHLAEPNGLAAVLQQDSPNFVSLVPTQLYRLLQDEAALQNLRSCKAIVLGGAAASQELLDQALKAGLPVSVSYGSSETAAQCTALPVAVLPKHIGDVGSLFPSWEYLHQGESLRLRGPACCLGMYQNQKFQPACDAEGWMTLPDRILCENGRLTVLGRADGLFQVAGENVSPADIVQPLESLRQVADFLALPDMDAEYGTVPVLIVRSPLEPPLDAIIALCKKHLTGVQRPRRIYWHRSDEIGKPSRSYYESSLQRHELPLLWSQDLGRV